MVGESGTAKGEIKSEGGRECDGKKERERDRERQRAGEERREEGR